MTMTGFTKTTDYFESQGLRCGSDLYLPEGVEQPPVVIMGHGFGAERIFGLPAYAERFAANGMAVMLFDYRCFGNSEGEPRNWIDPRRHLQDWQAALAYVRGLSQVDGSRIALWGSSYGGGHVIVTAARDGNVRAIVPQVPFIDAFDSMAHLGIGFVLSGVVPGLRDLGRIITGRSAYMVPIYGRPDDAHFSILNTAECAPGYESIYDSASDWKNECPARILLTFPLYRPIRYASRVECPVLLQYGRDDSLISAEGIRKTAAKMPNCELEELPFGHFEIYKGEFFEKAVTRQTAFLKRHLLASD